VNTSPITGGSRVGPQAVGVAGALGRLGRGRLGLIVQSWRSRWDVVNCRAERSTVPPENLAPSKVTLPPASVARSKATLPVAFACGKHVRRHIGVDVRRQTVRENLLYVFKALTASSVPPVGASPLRSRHLPGHASRSGTRTIPQAIDPAVVRQGRGQAGRHTTTNGHQTTDIDARRASCSGP
jgi:hypothetical protein